MSHGCISRCYETSNMIVIQKPFVTDPITIVFPTEKKTYILRKNDQKKKKQKQKIAMSLDLINHGRGRYLETSNARSSKTKRATKTIRIKTPSFSA